MGKFGLFNRFIAKDGERDTLAEILLEAAKSMEKIGDCKIYLVNVSNDDSNSVFVYEIWSSENAHQASLLLESTQTLIRSANPIIIGVERVNTFLPMGGKGSSNIS